MALAGSPSGREVVTGGRPQSFAVGQYPSTAALIVFAVLVAYILLKPYYFLPSGLPQVGDFLLVGALPFAMSLPKAPQNEHVTRFMFYMMLFCIYAALVSVIWTFLLMDPSVATSAIYYGFNFTLMFIFLRIGLLQPRATLIAIAYTLSVSAIIQAAMIVATFKAASLRQIAGFNNPNQLAYWSLLSLCIFWAIASKYKIKGYIQAATVVCLIYSSATALSKSGMIAVAFLCALHYIKKPKLFMIGLVALIPAYFLLDNSTLVTRINERLQNIGQQSDDSLYARGYTRIFDSPEYMVMGAGEGGLYRFEKETTASFNAAGKCADLACHEIHSTLGTIIFSYGIPGLATFCAALLCLYRLSSSGRFVYLLPPFLYGVTHQGLRTSFFWLLFVIVALLDSSDGGDVPARKNPRSAVPASPGPATVAQIPGRGQLDQSRAVRGMVISDSKRTGPPRPRNV
jgi:hypothetical protein